MCIRDRPPPEGFVNPLSAARKRPNPDTVWRTRKLLAQTLDQRRAQRERSIETSDFRHLSDRPRYDETARQQFGTLTLTQPLSPIAYARLKQKITRENYEKLPPPKAFSLVNLTRR